MTTYGMDDNNTNMPLEMINHIGSFLPFRDFLNLCTAHRGMNALFHHPIGRKVYVDAIPRKSNATTIILILNGGSMENSIARMINRPLYTPMDRSCGFITESFIARMISQPLYTPMDRKSGGITTNGIVRMISRPLYAPMDRSSGGITANASSKFESLTRSSQLVLILILSIKIIDDDYQKILASTGFEPATSEL